IEHLGRGTAIAVDMLIVVTEPTPQSIQTQARIKTLAEDLKMKRVAAVGSKVRGEADREYIRSNSTVQLLGFIPFDDSLLRGNLDGVSGEVIEEVKGVLYKMEGEISPEKISSGRQ
ncbi:MAG: carbon monoxide dehydrogenase, partial [bacterium]